MTALLVVTEHFAVGGLETYINTQADALAKQGWQLHLACGARFSSDTAGGRFTSVTQGLHVTAEANLAVLLTTVAQLRDIIRREKITAVHAHPFTTLLPALFAAKLEGVPLLVTLHGPTSVTGFYGPAYDYILTGLVAPFAERCLMVSAEVAALAQGLCGPEGLELHPNAIAQSQAPVGLEEPAKESLVPSLAIPKPTPGTWLVVSRLDADKVAAILEFVRFARLAGIHSIHIAGEGSHKDWLAQAAGTEVHFLGAQHNVGQLMPQYAGVAGMGRVVLEGAAAGCTVCLLGYDGVKGMLNEQRWAQASMANFSGRNLSNIGADEFKQQFIGARPVSASLLAEHDADTLWQRFAAQIAAWPKCDSTFICDLYRELDASRAFRGQGGMSYLHDGVLFEAVGRVIQAPQHFHAQRLACYQFYAQLMHQQITHRQQQQAQQALLQQINVHVTETIAGAVTQMEQNMKMELERQFWLKRALRGLSRLPANIVLFCRLFVQSPSKATYKLAKHVYWRLPAGLREPLTGVKHRFLRRFGSEPARAVLGADNRNDLSWKQFNEQVLSQRRQYKGIFVQEVVIDWDVPLYQRPQHIACAFGRLGYLVIYKTLNFSNDNVNGFREVAPNVWLTNSRKVNDITGVVRSFYSTAYSLPPEIINKLDPSSVVIYEYIDHIDPAISGDDENIRRLMALKDFAFSGGASAVVASAKKLEEEAIAAVGPEKVILAQNGVDTLHYRDPRHLDTQLPEPLLAFRKKYSNVVGYFGALAPWLWYDVVNELVASRPDLGFVFIGPDYYGGAQQLLKAENVLYLGAVDYQILPAYARQFDVCFIPFAPIEIARTTSPLKLFEYFALEKPVVVSSEMRECVVYDEVFHADSVAGFSSNIDKALAIKDNPEFKQRMATLADNNGWETRAQAMAVVFEQLK